MIAPAVTFEMLRERFLAGLDRRVSHLKATMALAAGSMGSERAVPLQELRRACHSLAGIGGTYGYFEITRTARVAELVCASMVESSEATDLRTLELALDRLIDATATAAKNNFADFPLRRDA